MIDFDSPAGARLRGLGVSRAGLAAIWFHALSGDQPVWAAWARDRMEAAHPGAAVTLALQMLQAVQDDDLPRARKIRVLLASLPLDQAECRILRSADEIGRTFLSS